MLTGTVVSGGYTGGVEEVDEPRFDIYDATGFHILTLVPLYLAARIIGYPTQFLLDLVADGGQLNSPTYVIKLFKQPKKSEMVAERNAWNAKHRYRL